MLVESGQERYLAFVVLPALTTFAGAAAAVGLDHVLSDSAEASRKGWYLLIGGVGFIIATGTGTLIWLRRGHRLTSGLVHAALYRGEHVATALTVLKHHAVRGQRSATFWTPPKRWPLIVLAITGFVIALGLPLADSRWPPVVIGIASGVAP